MNKLAVLLLVIVIVAVALGWLYYYLSMSGTGGVQTTTRNTTTTTITTTVTITTQVTTGELSSVEVEAIKYMAEEERLAYDVYTKLSQIYPDISVFANIAKSKETYVNAVLSLAEKYHISIKLGELGVYNNTHIRNCMIN